MRSRHRVLIISYFFVGTGQRSKISGRFFALRDIFIVPIEPSNDRENRSILNKAVQGMLDFRYL